MIEYTVRIQAIVYKDVVVDVDPDDLWYNKDSSKTEELLEANAMEYAEEVFADGLIASGYSLADYDALEAHKTNPSDKT
jgi:hypothetical protein